MIYVFEDYALDTGRRELRRGTKLVAVEPQVFDFLQYLISNRDRVVGKDDLIATVWGGRIVSESAISSRITAVRHAVGDSGEEQRLIRTIPRKGLRFVGEVREEQQPADAGPPTPPQRERKEAPALELGRDTPTDRLVTLRALRPPLNAPWLIATVVLLAGTGLVLPGLTGWWRPAPIPSGATAARAPAVETTGFAVPLAVLPFSPGMGSDIAPAALADSITDDLTNYLSRVGLLRVVARRAAAQESTSQPRDIGAKLNVRYIVSGTVRAQDEKIRLNVGLIDARSGLEVWSSHFAEDRSQWSALQDDLLRRITYSVHTEALRRGDGEPLDPSREPSVNQLLTRGWAGLLDGTDSPLFDSARAAFSEALRRDPESPSPMVGLAAYYVLAVSGLKIARDPYLAKAEDLLRLALAKGAHDHSVHFYLGVLYFLQPNLPAALQALDRAIAINPSFPAAYARKGRALIKLQRYREALENIRYALLLNGATTVKGWHLWVGLAELELGYDEEARQSFQRAVAALPENPYVRASLAALHALSGEWPDARRHIAALRERTPQLSDQRRLSRFNPGPDGKALPNRLGEGLRLALELKPELH